MDLYSDFQNRRQSTTWWLVGHKVNGRNAIVGKKNLNMMCGLDHLSFIWDVKILFKTVLKVIKVGN
jgi:lipopolysaccharide/colanic/teichoic acid biosynthesis glycosyltransferase